MVAMQTVFIAGATGYIGRRLCAELVRRGHTVIALARPGSAVKVPAGCRVAVGNALNMDSYAAQVPPGCTFIHLVGVAHPSPAKAAQFLSVDLASVYSSLRAARGAAHFVYISVAQPAPVMAAYVRARQAAEQLIARSGLTATILRPWYVLGPGHRWPWLLLPWYWIFERIPSTAQTARRLGLVTITQMLNALVYAVEHPVAGSRVFDVPRIRAPD